METLVKPKYGKGLRNLCIAFAAMLFLFLITAYIGIFVGGLEKIVLALIRMVLMVLIAITVLLSFYFHLISKGYQKEDPL